MSQDDDVRGEHGVKRRQVVKGAAWAAPVITMGVPASASAASPPPVAPAIDQANSCKHSNEKPQEQRYHISLTWTNTLDCDSSVRVSEIIVTPSSMTPVIMMGLPSTIDLGARGTASATQTVVYDSFATPNMANGTASISYTYSDCQGEDVPATVPITIPSLPPCQSMGLQWPH